MRIICYDFELGGLAEDCSLLTGCFKVADKVDNEFVVVDTLKFMIKHDVYKVQPEALKITGLNLEEIDSKGITLSKSGELLYKFLQKNTNLPERLVILGQGVSGDTKTIYNNILKPQNFHHFVSNNFMDTLVMAKMLQSMGLLPERMSLKLQDLCSYFGLTGFQFHECENDVDATMAVFLAMEKLIKNGIGS